MGVHLYKYVSHFMMTSPEQKMGRPIVASEVSFRTSGHTRATCKSRYTQSGAYLVWLSQGSCSMGETSNLTLSSWTLRIAPCTKSIRMPSICRGKVGVARRGPGNFMKRRRIPVRRTTSGSHSSCSHRRVPPFSKKDGTT